MKKKTHRRGALVAAAALWHRSPSAWLRRPAPHRCTTRPRAPKQWCSGTCASTRRITAGRRRRILPAGESHLWVSVKQAKSLRPENALKQEGSSAISAAWLERHPDASEYTCDGRMHTGSFNVDAGKTEPGGFGQLRPGQVYVQFCLTGPGGSETTPPDWSAIDQRFAAAG